jgi:hypothetical protein
MTGPWNEWVPAIAGFALGIAIMGFVLIDTWRLDARARRHREKAAAEPRPEK